LSNKKGRFTWAFVALGEIGFWHYFFCGSFTACSCFSNLSPFFLMDAKMLRARAVRQVLARPASQPPTTRALHLLMQYVRGHQSRELVNAQLQLGNQLHLVLGG
jgi:hypothetical protein